MPIPGKGYFAGWQPVKGIKCMAFKLYVTNMYFNYSFLLSNFYTNDFVPDFPGSGSIIVPVTKSIWEEKAYFFQKLYNTSTTFCFGFFQADEEWRNAELSNVRDALSLFF